MAVKCAKCQVFVHLRCTGLPEYQLVRLAVSQAQFSCANCVKTKDVEDEERYNAEVTNIREKIAKEISIIDQLEDGSKSAAASEEDTPKEETNNSNSKSKAICRYFLRRECKYVQSIAIIKFGVLPSMGPVGGQVKLAKPLVFA